MPGFNQKGPFGEGPMTGRRMGRCTNYGANQKQQTTEESENQRLSENNPAMDLSFERGRGFGFGRNRRGCGRGQRFRFRGGF